MKKGAAKMKTTTKRNEVPMGKPFIEVDMGNVRLFIYDIEHKSYVDVKSFEKGEIVNRCMIR